jgi:hypothetical protein
VDGQLEVRRVGVEESPWGELVEPDATSVWPRVATISEVWVLPDDANLVVGGHRGFETVLHSVEVEESAEAVGLLARIAFTREAARWRLEASEVPGETLIGIAWRTAVRLQSPLSGRAVIDRGSLQLHVFERNPSESLREKAIARLRIELSAAKTPSQRRRIRQTIEAIHRNPFKAASTGSLGDAREPGADLDG